MYSYYFEKSHSANVNDWSAMLYDASAVEAYFSRKYEIQLVGRVGGDSFATGLIYGLSTGTESQKAIEFATAASCLKQTIEGDYNRTTTEDVENLLRSGGNGRVQR